MDSVVVMVLHSVVTPNEYRQRWRPFGRFTVAGTAQSVSAMVPGRFSPSRGPSMSRPSCALMPQRSTTGRFEGY